MILVRFAICMFAFALLACAVSYSAASGDQDQTGSIAMTSR
jgi:hypothetical protein